MQNPLNNIANVTSFIGNSAHSTRRKILFENREVIQVEFILKKQKPKQKDNDKKVLEKYLKSCFDIVNKEENEKKRLDKD